MICKICKGAIFRCHVWFPKSAWCAKSFGHRRHISMSCQMWDIVWIIIRPIFLLCYLRLFFQRLVGDGRRLPNQSIDLAAEQPAGSWCMSVCLYAMHASMHPCIHPSTDRWMHGCMDECMNVSYVMLCCIILYHIMLYYIILYYIILYYIIL
jgi:hypothetical protein